MEYRKDDKVKLLKSYPVPDVEEGSFGVVEDACLTNNRILIKALTSKNKDVSFMVNIKDIEFVERETSEEDTCSFCGSKHLEYKGTEVVNEQLFYSWTCKNCGGYGEEWYKLEFDSMIGKGQK